MRSRSREVRSRSREVRSRRRTWKARSRSSVSADICRCEVPAISPTSPEASLAFDEPPAASAALAAGSDRAALPWVALGGIPPVASCAEAGALAPSTAAAAASVAAGAPAGASAALGVESTSIRSGFGSSRAAGAAAPSAKPAVEPAVAPAVEPGAAACAAGSSTAGGALARGAPGVACRLIGGRLWKVCGSAVAASIVSICRRINLASDADIGAERSARATSNARLPSSGRLRVIEVSARSPPSRSFVDAFVIPEVEPARSVHSMSSRSVRTGTSWQAGGALGT